MDEIEVKVPWRHGGGSFIGRAEKQISLTRDRALQPLQLVRPDLVTGYIDLIRALHDLFQGFVVVSVHLGGAGGLGPRSIRASKSSAFFRPSKNWWLSGFDEMNCPLTVLWIPPTPSRSGKAGRRPDRCDIRSPYVRRCVQRSYGSPLVGACPLRLVTRMTGPRPSTHSA